MSPSSALEKGLDAKRSAVDVRGWALMVLSFQTLGKSTVRENLVAKFTQR